ncbi:protease complex subunit PrcB family protein [Flavobacterium sp.]|uniref:protease complex subunit PrcB family protein n=1 Tax=Flavobacterium sp. TaxID=239 RepID=UPI00334137A4
MFKNIVSLIGVCLLFLSCKPAQQVVAKEKDKYEVVFKSQIGGKKEKSTQIIKNYEEFNALITTLNVEEESFGKLLAIDLEKYDLVACFLGEKTTGGYDIDIADVLFTATTAQIILKEIGPEKNEIVTDAFTSPYLFVLVPKNKTILVN